MIGGIHGQRGISDRVVKTSTGKDWGEWLEIIDEWSGKKHSFTTITKYLMERHELNYYWAQAVAVHYVWKRLYSNEHWNAKT